MQSTQKIAKHACLHHGYRTSYVLYDIYFISLIYSLAGFYVQKQLLLSAARLSHHNSVHPSVHLSICLSVHLSHGLISQKRCKLGSPNFHRRLPGRL